MNRARWPMLLCSFTLLAAPACEEDDGRGSGTHLDGGADAGADAAPADGDGGPAAVTGDPDGGGEPDVEVPRCTPGQVRAEGCPQQGVCAGATATCGADGAWGECVLPDPDLFDDGEEEVRCDGLDNDCDGEADEPWPDLLSTCDSEDEDLCEYGQWRCAEDGLGAVCADDEPQVEDCDGVDNDCDGRTDEEVPGAPLAAQQEGVCAGAVQACIGLEGWTEPDYSELEGYEAVEATCDGLDNDCDSRTDAGLFAPLADFQDGVCAGQLKLCGAAEGWVEPAYDGVFGFEAEEVTCDGQDNDCNGEVDEELVPPPCDRILGVCREPVAERPCEGLAGFGVCDYGIYYQRAELNVCDALDNDCDGDTDEGAACPVARAAVLVLPGTYERGSHAEEQGHQDDETQADVTLTRALLVRRTEVTQTEWLGVMGGNPAFTQGSDRPVEQVSWDDAAAFANALSARDGLPACYVADGGSWAWPAGLDCEGWRLPTEAEWEYLARGGTTAATWAEEQGVALEDAAWYADNAGGRHQPVAGRAASPFDLYDVYGNVAEWVWDRYAPYPEGPETDPVGPAEGAERVVRGGSYASLRRSLRSADRTSRAPGASSATLGLRLVRTAPAGAVPPDDVEEVE